MTIGQFKISLIDDFTRWHKLASVRVSLILTAFYGALVAVLPLAADHWPEIAPFVFKFFPGADQAVGPFIGALLTIAARLISIQRHEK